jgi:hypothetical protein
MMLYVLLFETCISAFSAHGERESTLEKEKKHAVLPSRTLAAKEAKTASLNVPKKEQRITFFE